MLAPFAPVEVTLSDGRRVRLREIRPEDRDEVRQAFARLSDESRYFRFMSCVKELSPRMLEGATHPREGRELGLVAEIPAPDGIDIVGGARYFVLPDDQSCEFAVTVADGWHRVGLASRLMRALIEGARERGLQHMEGFVLEGNHAMLSLGRRLGFGVKRDPRDQTVMIVRLPLAVPARGDDTRPI